MESRYDQTPCPCGSGKPFGGCCGLTAGTAYPEMFAFVRNHPVQGPLYRIFREREHADSFFIGQVRVSTLEQCRNLENSEARDTQEGIAVVGIGQTGSSGCAEPQGSLYVDNEIPQPAVPLVHLGDNTVKLENAYVLCLSADYSDYMRKVYGNYCIMIEKPAAFFYLVNAVMRNLNLIAESRPGPIIYDDNVFLNLNYTSTSGGVGFYKGERFAMENEYRLRLLPLLPEIEPILIEISSMPSICQKMYR